MIDKIKSYIGLAQRSGSILYGEDIILEKKRLVKVVLIDKDAPDKYKQRLLNKISNLPIFEVEDICKALHRDGVYSIAVTNENLANAIINLLR